MIRAFAYLQLTTLKNRLVSQARRFKQPKYWLGAIVFGIYLWTFFLRHLLPGSRRNSLGSVGEGFGTGALFLMETGFAFLLLGMLVLAWVFPKDRAALDFTEAEIAFLFPAPVSRRTLVNFKLLRWQLGSLFGALFFTLLSSRNATAQGAVVRHILAWWLLMSVINLHGVGASFFRTRLLDRGVTTWQRRAAVLGFCALLGVVAALWLRANVPPIGLAQIESAPVFAEWLHEAVDSGPVYWFLLPFRVLLQPFFAGDALAFALACVPVLGVGLLHYGWVIRSDTAFEEATIEKAAKRAQIMSAAKAGNWAAARAATSGTRRGKPLFNLRPDGFRPVAIAWKNLVAIGNVFSLRVWFGIAGLALAAAVFARVAYPDSPVLLVCGMFSAGIAAYMFFLGPQILRQDLRTDLAQADLLKLLPLPGWQIVLGEILAPLIALTAGQWLLLVIGGVLLTGGGGAAKLPLVDIAGIGIAAALLLPLVNLAAFLVLNGAVLAFPAWFTLGPAAAQGFEATGQRMILAIGQVLVLLVALVIPGLLFAALFIVAKVWLGIALAVIVAALAAALALAAECAAGVWLLGILFERMDVSAESSV